MKNLIIYTFFIYASQLQSQSQIIQISGKIVDRPIDTLILVPSGSDTRYNGIKIPIHVDSTFFHEIKTPHIEEYSLIFQNEQKSGMWKTIDFFTDSNAINFEIHSYQESEKNIINGSKLTNEKREFYEALKVKFEKSSEKWFGKLFSSEKDSDGWKIAKLKTDSLNFAMLNFQQQYFADKPNILGFNEYVKLLNSAKQRDLKAKDFQPFQAFWLKRFPSHPLAEKAVNLYTALSTLAIGSKFIEFTTVDQNMKSISFSDQFHDKKIIMLDLWAPWCGPCIKKSRVLLENQKELSAKGLQVVSVIGGISSREEFVETLDKHKYPWKSYMEIKDENSIWEKYGITNSGGSQYLFDKTGKLIAINPTKLELFLALDP